MKSMMSAFSRAVILPMSVFLALSVSAAAQTREHRVRRGETVYGIARQYDVEPSALVLINDLSRPDLLTPGMVLQVPQDSSAIVHQVERGDTLYSIARRYGVDVAEIQRSNGLDDTTIQPGQQLTIIGSDFRPTPSVAASEPQASDERGVTAVTQSSTPDRSPGPQRQPDGVAVAPVVRQPLSYSQGGAWPVTGTRADLDGKLPGVLIRGSRGDEVLAVATGRVVYAGPHTTFGNVVLVRSGAGYVYVYGGQEGLSVGVGDSVEAGSTLGTVGSSPTHGDGTVYFSVWKNDEFIDPGSAPRG